MLDFLEITKKATSIKAFCLLKSFAETNNSHHSLSPKREKRSLQKLILEQRKLLI